jgi:hypothetical protein
LRVLVEDDVSAQVNDHNQDVAIESYDFNLGPLLDVSHFFGNTNGCIVEELDVLGS